MTRPAPAERPRVVAVADSDSYVKWGAATLDRLPAEWECELLVIRSPLLPSVNQFRAALTGTRIRVPQLVTRWSLRRALRLRRPDIVLAAATGPVADLVLRTAATLTPRPLLVSGLPGMSIPATAKAVALRAQSDVFVAHSLREQREFSARAAELGLDQMRVMVSRLPFLSGPGPDPAGSPAPHSRTPADITRVVFAPQAKVPAGTAARERILLALDALAAARPDVEVVVKLRSAPGEPQTHREQAPFDELWRDLVARRLVEPGSVAFRTGALQDWLVPGTALATVSSTAVLEAIATGLPVLVLGDFGVDDANLTSAFAGSGAVGTLADLRLLDFRWPSAGWLADNYFHAGDETAAELLDILRTRRSAPVAAGRPAPLGADRRTRLRVAVRTGLPLGLLRLTGRALRTLRRAQRRLRRHLGAGAGVGTPLPEAALHPTGVASVATDVGTHTSDGGVETRGPHPAASTR